MTRRLVLVGLTLVFLGVGVSFGWADTVRLWAGQELRGLVLEERPDRVVLSTLDGEMILSRREIAEIQFDPLAQRLLKQGRRFESRGDLEQALSAYEGALGSEPGLLEAQAGVLRVRKKIDQMDWQVGGFLPKMQEFLGLAKEEIPSPELATLLKAQLGLALEMNRGAVRILGVDANSAGSQAGLQDGDEIVGIGDQPAASLPLEDIAHQLLGTSFSQQTLTYEREVRLRRPGGVAPGFAIRPGLNGFSIEEVSHGGPADQAGLKEGDRITKILDQPTRLMSLKMARRILEEPIRKEVLLTYRREVTLLRR